MATIDLGKIRFNWQGVFNNSVSYVKNDIVSNGGGTYICKLPATGIAVSNTTYWDVMSSPGTNGTNGTNGTDVGTVITTQGDILYRDGSGLQRLAKGTASQQLAMNSGATAPEWVTPSAGGLGHFKARSSSNQSISSNSNTKVTWNTNDLDTASVIDLTNNRVVLPSGQTWMLYSHIYFGNKDANGNVDMQIMKNGSLFTRTDSISGNAVNDYGISITAMAVGNGSDYFEIFTTQTGSTENIEGSSIEQTVFLGWRVA